MTSPRRDKDGNIIAPKGSAKRTNKAFTKRTKAEGKLKGFEAIAKRKALAALGKAPRAKAAGKTYDIAKSNPRLAKKLIAKNRAVDNADLTNRAAKKVNKLEKQADGLAAIANRKSARTGRGITAKSNPKLFKKLENKRKAVGRIKNRNR